MAEAAVETVENSQKFYCHQCTSEINPKLPDFTCPQCDNGFIEEITEDLSHSSNESSNSVTPGDTTSQFADLWGRAFIESFRDNASHSHEDADNLSHDGGSDDEEMSTRPRRHRPVTRVSLRRERPVRNQYLQGLLQYFVDRLAGDQGIHVHGATPGIPIQMFHLHGNPEDYAWGAGGLDSIITQLLNQLEGSGAPPAEKDKIEALPVVKISQEQVDKKVQCSVCMEDFEFEEDVKKLPCDHHYHKDCIDPWLQLHGTCPVCRKDLNGADVPVKDEFPPPSDSSSDGFSSDSFNGNSSSTSSDGSSPFGTLE